MTWHAAPDRARAAGRDGEVPARLTIGGPGLVLKDARGIALDVKNQNVMVSDKTLNAVLTFHVPEAFQ